MADASPVPQGNPADDEAVTRALAAVPVLSRIEAASTAIGLPAATLLHAGPAFRTVDEIARPILNSASLTAVLAGLADSFEDAESEIRAGAITLAPAQDWKVVTPLAFVASAVTPLQVITDAAGSGATAYATINDGNHFPSRVGQCTQEVFQQLRWMSVAIADRFDAALAKPMPILPLALRGLMEGDDCHGRTNAASLALVEELNDRLPRQIGDAAEDFLQSSTGLFLNIWMGACKCMMLAGSGVRGSSLVTAAGGNGVETGIQISAFPGRWFTAEASPPRGDIPRELNGRSLGAVGDSAVVEGLGLGAMALRLSPAQRKAFRHVLPNDYDARVGALLAMEHPVFSALGVKLGILARQVVRYGHGPVVGLGILDRDGIEGRIGGGIYEMPVTPFRDAVAILDAQKGARVSSA